MDTTMMQAMYARSRKATILVLALAGAFLAPDSLAGDPEREADVLKSQMDRQNYVLGLMTARQLGKQSVQLAPEAFMLGMKDGASGGDPLLTQAEIAELVLGIGNEMKRKQAERLVEKRAMNKQAGESFLAENKAKEGIVTRESGLQYRILKAGEGRKPSPEEAVMIHYRGTLIDGTEFGNSYRGDEPKTLLLKKAIAGWREALPLMPVGSKWQLFVPPHLAYGKRGAGKVIGPNSTLVFEVELLDVKDASASTEASTLQPDLVMSEAGANPGKPGKSAAASDVAGISIAYKLDPRLTKSLYMGERWVSPPTYTAVQDEKGLSVEARAQALDDRGGRVDATPVWESGDAGVVRVTPQGKDVTLTILKEGHSELKVSAAGASKKLALKAVRENDVLRVEITQ